MCICLAWSLIWVQQHWQAEAGSFTKLYICQLLHCDVMELYQAQGCTNQWMHKANNTKICL